MGQHTRAARRRRPAAIVATAVAALAPAGAAAAAPAIVAPLDVSARGASADGLRAGMDGDGGVVVVWQARTGAAASVMAATRPPGGPPAAPVAISGPGGSAPALAVASSGEALTAWWRPGEGGTVVQASGRVAGGAFAPAVDLSAPGSFAPQVALAPGGGAVVAWLRFDGATTVVEAALRPPGGAFGAPVALSEPGRSAFAPRVAVQGGGRVVIAWNRSDGRLTRIEAAVGTLAGGLSPSGPISAPGEDAYDPQVAPLPAGGALIAWTRSDGAVTRTELARLGADGSAGPPATLSAPGADATQPQVAVDGAGAALVAWRRGPAGAERVQVLARSAAGAVAEPADLSPSGVGAAEPRLALDAAGRAVVAWRRTDGSDPRVQIATRDPGGAFGAPVDVSTRGAVIAEPRVALDGGGNGVVAWRRADGDDDVVQMAGLDDAPPVLLEVTVPAGANIGETVRFGVRARDVWSPLAPGPTWSFGPDSGALGAMVEHAFPAAGAYLVRVAQADTTGRVAVAERRVEVAAPAPVVVLRTAPAPAPASRGVARTRRPVPLRVGWRWERAGGRAWLRVRGVTSPGLAGRRVVVDRRAGGRAVVLCRVPIARRGRIDGRCRADRLARAGVITVRVRARVGATRATRARALPYVTRSLRIGPVAGR